VATSHPRPPLTCSPLCCPHVACVRIRRQYYEKLQDFGKAGKFYSLCGQYTKALRLFLQCGDREIDAAIDAVGRSPEKERDRLAHQLIDFLVGEKDGIPKVRRVLLASYLRPYLGPI